MRKHSAPIWEPLPYYMTAMGMQGARFIEGVPNTVTGSSTEGTPPPAGDEPNPAGTQEEPKDEPLGDGGKKALEAERHRAKTAERALAEAEAKIKTFEDAGKTEAEKNAERLKAAETSAAQATRKALQYEAAAKAGIPLAVASRLNGSNLDELVADAEALKALGIGAQKQVPPPPDPSQGNGGKTSPTSLSEALTAHYSA